MASASDRSLFPDNPNECCTMMKPGVLTAVMLVYSRADRRIWTHRNTAEAAAGSPLFRSPLPCHTTRWNVTSNPSLKPRSSPRNRYVRRRDVAWAQHAPGQLDIVRNAIGRFGRIV